MTHPPYPVSPRRILPEGATPPHDGLTTWWSSIKRDGEWTLPRMFRAFACMGNVELDLTTAYIGVGESVIDVRCILANVEITVPRDIRVLCEGEGLGGNFEVVRIGDTTPPPDAPTLRVTGNAYLGSVQIKVLGTVGPGWKDKLKAGWQQLNS